MPPSCAGNAFGCANAPVIFDGCFRARCLFGVFLIVWTPHLNHRRSTSIVTICTLSTGTPRFSLGNLWFSHSQSARKSAQLGAMGARSRHWRAVRWAAAKEKQRQCLLRTRRDGNEKRNAAQTAGALAKPKAFPMQAEGRFSPFLSPNKKGSRQDAKHPHPRDTSSVSSAALKAANCPFYRTHCGVYSNHPKNKPLAALPRKGDTL